MTDSQLERLRAVVRPWVEIRDITSTEGLPGQAVFLLSAPTLGSLTTGQYRALLLTRGNARHNLILIGLVEL